MGLEENTWDVGNGTASLGDFGFVIIVNLHFLIKGRYFFGFADGSIYDTDNGGVSYESGIFI